MHNALGAAALNRHQTSTMARGVAMTIAMTAKGCLSVGVFMLVAGVVLAGGFVFLVRYFFTHEPDQRSLSKEAVAKVVATRDLADEWGVIYSYQIGGRTYYARTVINHRFRRPSGELIICVDPHNQVQNAMAMYHKCGSPDIGGTSETATLTKPSW